MRQARHVCGSRPRPAHLRFPFWPLVSPRRRPPPDQSAQVMVAGAVPPKGDMTMSKHISFKAYCEQVVDAMQGLFGIDTSDTGIQPDRLAIAK